MLVCRAVQEVRFSIHVKSSILHSSSLLQVKVVDRTAVITENAETIVMSPAGIQEDIDAETGKLIL